MYYTGFFMVCLYIAEKIVLYFILQTRLLLVSLDHWKGDYLVGEAEVCFTDQYILKERSKFKVALPNLF